MSLESVLIIFLCELSEEEMESIITRQELILTMVTETFSGFTLVVGILVVKTVAGMEELRVKLGGCLESSISSQWIESRNISIKL